MIKAERTAQRQSFLFVLTVAVELKEKGKTEKLVILNIGRIIITYIMAVMEVSYIGLPPCIYI